MTIQAFWNVRPCRVVNVIMFRNVLYAKSLGVKQTVKCLGLLDPYVTTIL